MNKQELNEHFFDEMIRYATAEISEEMGNQFLSDKELRLKYKPSVELDVKMHKLFKQLRRKEQIARIRKTALKVAAVVLVFLTASFFTIMNVDALRIRLINYLLERDDKSTTIFINNSDGSFSTQIMPTYLPEGYKNIQLEITGNSYFAVYENNNGDNIFLYSIK